SRTLLAKSRKFSSRATKSVSLLTSTMMPLLPSSAILVSTVPSAAIRPAFLAAFMPLALRRSSIALSMSPSASTRAFLQSIMPRPVRSRSSLTIPAVILAILLPLQLQKNFQLYESDFKKKGRSPSFFIACAASLCACSRTTFVSTHSRSGSRSSVIVADFDELAVATYRIELATTFKAGICYSAGIQLDCPNGVIVARNREINAVRVAVGVNYADHRDAKVVGFSDGNAFVVHVDHEQGIRQAA